MMEDVKDVSRRAFLGRTGKLAAAAAVAGSLDSSPLHGQERAAPGVGAAARKRVALVGTGSRGSQMWGRDLVGPYADYVEMVGLCDVNPKRLEVAREIIGVDAPGYPARDFDRMVRETRPDLVIVTTTDCFHADYIVRAMELGCDVLSEKPVATDAEQCQRILDAEVRTGKKLLVGFNARHGASSEEIKRVLQSGVLGRVVSAEYQEYLDVDHGASYFRRWHGRARYSGTLLVHKASHHFDQMNWWLGADPVEVHAFGRLAVYGKNHPFRGRQCRGCAFKEQCSFHWDITKDPLAMKLYVGCEDADGYIRDGCVWDNAIDTYDSMTVEVRYDNDTLLSYSLVAFSPYEGQRIAFNGEHGRLDVRLLGGTEFQLHENFKGTRTWQPAAQTEPAALDKGHGGSDGRLKNLLFMPDYPDPLGKRAGSHAGIMSSLIGIAARTSIETGERVRIKELIDRPVSWRW
jgi:predicted dehydrogenase